MKIGIISRYSTYAGTAAPTIFYRSHLHSLLKICRCYRLPFSAKLKEVVSKDVPVLERLVLCLTCMISSGQSFLIFRLYKKVCIRGRQHSLSAACVTV